MDINFFETDFATDPIGAAKLLKILESEPSGRPRSVWDEDRPWDPIKVRVQQPEELLYERFNDQGILTCPANLHELMLQDIKVVRDSFINREFMNGSGHQVVESIIRLTTQIRCPSDQTLVLDRTAVNIFEFIGADKEAKYANFVAKTDVGGEIEAARYEANLSGSDRTLVKSFPFICAYLVRIPYRNPNSWRKEKEHFMNAFRRFNKQECQSHFLPDQEWVQKFHDFAYLSIDQFRDLMVLIARNDCIGPAIDEKAKIFEYFFSTPLRFFGMNAIKQFERAATMLNIPKEKLVSELGAWNILSRAVEYIIKPMQAYEEGDKLLCYARTIHLEHFRKFGGKYNHTRPLLRVLIQIINLRSDQSKQIDINKIKSITDMGHMTIDNEFLDNIAHFLVQSWCIGGVYSLAAEK